MRYITLLLLPLLFTFNSCDKEDDKKEVIINPVDSLKCNGYAELCDKRYNEVAYATTHNAHAALPYGFSEFAANQHLTVTEQLNGGVRCLNIKTYYTDDTNCGTLDHYLYHGFPLLGCILVSDFLDEVKLWVDANPNEVLTFTIEGSSSLSKIVASFTAAGFDDMLYQHTDGEPWPTLKSMIETGKRIVVLVSRSGTENYVGYIDYWNTIFGNDYAASSRLDFECALDNRGNNTSGTLFLMNHFITKLSPQRDSARAINSNPFLLTRAIECQQDINHLPNFVMVDFFGEGDVFEVVKELNGVN